MSPLLVIFIDPGFNGTPKLCKVDVILDIPSMMSSRPRRSIILVSINWFYLTGRNEKIRSCIDLRAENVVSLISFQISHISRNRFIFDERSCSEVQLLQNAE